MQGFSVYLASRTEEENQLLKRKLEPLSSDFKQMKFIGLHPQGLASSAHDKTAAAIVNVTEWNRNEMSSLVGLRAAGYHGPVLVMAKMTQSQALNSLRVMDSVVFLEKPFEPKDLVGIVRKMLHARAVAQRVFRRFSTDESAEILSVGKTEVFESRVVNLSKGGAYLESIESMPVQIGDLVRLKVALKDVNRSYTVPSRVVWTGRAMEGRPGAGTGVQFVGAPDVRKMTIGAY